MLHTQLVTPNHWLVTQQLTPPCMNTYTSTPGNTENRNRTHQHTDSTKLSVPCWDRTYNALVSILLNQLIAHHAARHMIGMHIYFSILTLILTIFIHNRLYVAITVVIFGISLEKTYYLANHYRHFASPTPKKRELPVESVTLCLSISPCVNSHFITDAK